MGAHLRPGGPHRTGLPGNRGGDHHRLLPDRVFSGEVFFIGSEAEFTPRNVQTDEERTRLVYPVKVRITDDEELALKPGLPADVLIPGSGTDGP